MRIEVLEGNEDPVIYPFKSSKLILGSGENCDIIISASGISRKHLVLSVEDEKYFVIDQGSTNGSFINEERLIPGKKVEFTSFFPVRLGENVLISLLSDEEGFDSDFIIPVPKERTSPSIQATKINDSTTVINLRDLQNVKTENLVLERNKKRETRKKASSVKNIPEKPKKKINYTAWFSFLIVVAAAYYNFFLMAPEPVEETRHVGQVVKVENTSGSLEEPTQMVPKVNPDLVAESDIPDKQYTTKLLNNMKCAIDSEIYLCDTIAGAREGKFGVTQVGLTLHVLLDGTRYYSEARMRVPDPKDDELIRQTAAYLALMRMPHLDEELLKDSRMIISLFKPSDTGYVADTIIAIKPKVLNREKENFNEDHLRHLKRIGAPTFEYTKKFYTVR